MQQDSTRIIRVADDQNTTHNNTTIITPRYIPSSYKVSNQPSAVSHNRLLNVFDNITNSESDFSKLLREKNQRQKFEKFFHGLLDKSNNVSPQNNQDNDHSSSNNSSHSNTPDFEEDDKRS